jgi:hypothetical protein
MRRYIKIGLYYGFSIPFVVLIAAPAILIAGYIDATVQFFKLTREVLKTMIEVAPK